MLSKIQSFKEIKLKLITELYFRTKQKTFSFSDFILYLFNKSFAQSK